MKNKGKKIIILYYAIYLVNKQNSKLWVLSIITKEVKLKDVVKVCPHSQRSLER